MWEHAPSLRQQQRKLAGELRAAGRTWAEVAALFRVRYRLNARVALRLAHGWSQREVSRSGTGAGPMSSRWRRTSPTGSSGRA